MSVNELEVFAAKSRERFCAVCGLPQDVRVLIDKARSDFEAAGPGSYKRPGHISVPQMLGFLASKGHILTGRQMYQHFDRGHHRA